MVYVAAANRIGLEKYLPIPTESNFGRLIYCRTTGEILAQASHDKEEILIC
jgi:N-carbamoylputrescine amidase